MNYGGALHIWLSLLIQVNISGEYATALLSHIISPFTPTLSPCRHYVIKPQRSHSTRTDPTIMPASFMTATLFPEAAMRPSLVAEPLSDVLMAEKVSDYRRISMHHTRQFAQAHVPSNQ